jgi:hypothetical protein
LACWLSSDFTDDAGDEIMTRNKPVDDATFVTAWCEYAPKYGIKRVAQELGMSVQGVYTRTSYLRRKRKMKLPPYQKVQLNKNKETALDSFLSTLKDSNIPFNVTKHNKFGLPESIQSEINNLAMRVLFYHLENTSK